MFPGVQRVKTNLERNFSIACCMGPQETLWAPVRLNAKKLQFMHTVSGDRSKTAKIIIRQY